MCSFRLLESYIAAAETLDRSSLFKKIKETTSDSFADNFGKQHLEKFHDWDGQIDWQSFFDAVFLEALVEVSGGFNHGNMSLDGPWIKSFSSLELEVWKGCAKLKDIIVDKLLCPGYGDGILDYLDAWKLGTCDEMMVVKREGIIDSQLRTPLDPINKKPVFKKKPKFSFSEAIISACNDAGLSAVNFADRFKGDATVRSYFQVKFAIIEHVRNNPDDVVFLTAEDPQSAKWLGFGNMQEMGALFYGVVPFAMAWRGEDYVKFEKELYSPVAVKQNMSVIACSNLECSVCLEEVTDENCTVIANSNFPFSCGHSICMNCYQPSMQSCPVCRKTKTLRDASGQDDKNRSKGKAQSPAPPLNIGTFVLIYYLLTTVKHTQKEPTRERRGHTQTI